MRIDYLRLRLSGLGAGPGHQDHVLRQWLQAQPLEGGPRRPDAFLPKALRRALPQLADLLAGLCRVRSEHPGADGSARLLVDLSDGQTVESVLLPRDGVCV